MEARFALAGLHPGERHWAILSNLIVTTQSRGSLVPDAPPGALALETGAQLQTSDLDFSRYASLKVNNPLA